MERYTPGTIDALPVALREQSEASAVLPLVRLLFRYRFVLVAFGAIPAIITGVLVFRTKPSYTSTASFVPLSRSSSSLPSNLAGLAMQFGVSLPATDATLPPAYWSDLAHSHQVLARLSHERFGGAKGDSVELRELLGVTAKDSNAAEHASVKKLESVVKAAPVVRSGLIQLTVSATDPKLSADIARRVLDILIEISAERRQRTSNLDYAFFEREQDSALADVNRADAAVIAFKEANRGPVVSPRLMVELQQLSRRADAKLTLANALAQAAAQARLEADRSAPAISVVEEPFVPFERNARGTISKAFLAGVVGVVVGALALVARLAMRRVRTVLTADDGANGSQARPDGLTMTVNR